MVSRVANQMVLATRPFDNRRRDSMAQAVGTFHLRPDFLSAENNNYLGELAIYLPRQRGCL